MSATGPHPEPKIRQPQTDEQFEAELDAALDRHERTDQLADGLSAEPKPEPVEPDYSTLVKVATEEGVSLNDVPADELPEGIDLSDEAALRAHVSEIREHEREDQAVMDAYAQQQDEEWARQEENAVALDDARSILDLGEPSNVWQAAKIVQQQHPEIFDTFLAEWTETDPDSARVWASQNPPIDWNAKFEEIEDRAAVAEAQSQQQAIADTFTKRVAELEADPKAAPYVEAAQRLIGMQIEAGMHLDADTPEQVERLLDASVKTAREVSRTIDEADEVARLLAPIEEKIQLNEAIQVEELGGVFPDLVDRDELIERTRAELVADWGFRGPQPTPEAEEEAFAESIFQAQRTLHPSIREQEDRTPEQEAALARAQKERRAARMRELQGRRR